jgi:hypothetical protein
VRASRTSGARCHPRLYLGRYPSRRTEMRLGIRPRKPPRNYHLCLARRPIRYHRCPFLQIFDKRTLDD